jgi:hypothetical protein
MASEFVVIQGDQQRKVEPNEPYRKEFKIEGMDSGASAIVYLMIKGFTEGDPVEVAINGSSIGQIFPQGNVNPEAWFTQMLHFSASEGALNPNPKNSSEVNTIEIPGPGGSKNFPKFYIMNIVCFYKPHQA